MSQSHAPSFDSEMFDALAANPNEVMFRTNAEGVVEFVSDGAVHLLGYHPSDIVGKRFSEFIHPDDLPRIEESFQELTRGILRPDDYRLLMKDGSFCWVRSSSLPITRNGQFIGIVGTLSNIHQQKMLEQQLAQSEARFRSAFYSTGVPNAIVSLDGTIQQANPPFTRLLGYTERELVNMNLSSLSHQEDIGKDRTLFELLSPGQTQTFELRKRFLRRDGRTIWVTISGTLVRDADGAPQHYIIQMQDITEKRRIETAYKLLVDHSLQGLVIVQNKNVVFANDMAFFMAGYSRNELNSGLDLRALIHPEDRPPLRHLMALAESGKTFNERMEVRILQRDGSVRWLEAYLTVVEFEGKPAVQAAVVDITERRKAEHLAAEHKQRLELALRGANMGTWDIDLQTGALRYDEQYARIHGRSFPYEPMRAGTFTDIHPEDLPTMVSAWNALNKGIVPSIEIEYRVKTSTGDWRWVYDRGSVTEYAPNGTPLRIGGITRDIDESKKLESSFLHAQRLENLGVLASGIAHDLNNILSPILMGSQILRPKVSDPTLLKTINVIEASAHRGSSIVRQVLAFARGLSSNRIPTQPKQILREIGRLIDETFPKNIQLEVEYPKDLPLLIADPTQMHQVLLNLCVNARDAMPRGGTLELKALPITIEPNSPLLHTRGAYLGNFVCFSVKDTGAGIPKEVLPKIFESFFTTKKEGSGTGLGLFTVRTIVAGHGGFVSVESEVGKGSVFSVFIPIAEESKAEDHLTPHADLLYGRGELILVVEDEAFGREMVKETLEGHGYRVLTASNGVEGISQFEKHAADLNLVLTDLNMPGSNGFELIERIRSMSARIPIITMTGYVTDESLGSPALKKVTASIQKPFTALQLLETIQDSLRH